MQSETGEITSEMECIRLAADGDRKALSALLNDYRNMIAAVVGRFIDDTESRKDVLQNVLINLSRNIGRFGGRCRFSTWVYRIALNECCTYLRKVKNKPRKHEEYSEIADLSSGDGLSKTAYSELRSEIMTALACLPLDQKTAFTLFYIGGYRGKEAAQALNITEANFFMKLKAARTFVRKRLQAGGYYGETGSI